MKSQEELEKIAQRRSLLQWLHEKVNVPRQLAEGFVPVFSEQMSLIREVDDEIREEARFLKDDLKAAKNSLRERKYLDVAHFIGNINDTLRDMGSKIKRLSDLREEHIGDFYEEHEYASPDRNYFGKSAGIIDFLKGIDRIRAAKYLEKMYQRTLGERKRAMSGLVNQTDAMVRFTFDILSRLGTYRAKGDINNYILELDKLNQRRTAFETQFKSVYDAYLTPLVKKDKPENVEKAVEPRQSKEQQEQQQEQVPEVEKTLEVPTVEPTSEAPQIVQLVTEPEKPKSGYTSEEEEFYKKYEGVDLSEIPEAEIPASLNKLKGLLDKPKVAEHIAQTINDKSVLLKYSEVFDRLGHDLISLECLAIAEGLDE